MYKQSNGPPDTTWPEHDLRTDQLVVTCPARPPATPTAQARPNKARVVPCQHKGMISPPCLSFNKVYFISLISLVHASYGWNKFILPPSSLWAVPYMAGISIFCLPHLFGLRIVGPCHARPARHAEKEAQAWSNGQAIPRQPYIGEDLALWLRFSSSRMRRRPQVTVLWGWNKSISFPLSLWAC